MKNGMSYIHWILLLAISGLVLSCTQKTPQEKLEAAIQKNPELAKEIEQDFRSLQFKSLLHPLDSDKLPEVFQSMRNKKTNATYFEIDLDLDNQVEYAALEYQKGLGRLLIYKMNLQDSSMVQYTDFLSAFPKDSTTLTALPGLLKWKSKQQIEDALVQQELHIRFEEAKRAFVLTHYQKESIQATSMERLSCNFITGNGSTMKRNWSAEGKQGEKETSTFSIAYRLPVLRSISDEFLNQVVEK